MAITICFGLQKGGVGKTTTTALTSYILSKKNRVLSIDFDSQGNLTEILTQKEVSFFDGKTGLEAIQKKEIDEYIYTVNENLDVLPADDGLAVLPNRLVSMYKTRKDQLFALHRLIEPVKSNYDYILIDLPPNLGDHTLNAMVASDYAVIIMQTEPWAYGAVERYIQTLEMVQESLNPNLTLAGILTCLMQSTVKVDHAIKDQINSDYEDVVFKTVIKKVARIKEFSLYGINIQNKSDEKALKNYNLFVQELVERVKT